MEQQNKINWIKIHHLYQLKQRDKAALSLPPGVFNNPVHDEVRDESTTTTYC